jgi:hypothetical protein
MAVGMPHGSTDTIQINGGWDSGLNVVKLFAAVIYEFS